MGEGASTERVPGACVLRVLVAGPHVSVQDRGRLGYRRYGVSVSGPMDWVRHALALRLAGCGPEDPALEIGPGAFVGEIDAGDGRSVQVGLAGPGHVAVLRVPGRARMAVPLPASLCLPGGSRLELRPTGEATWATLAVAGIDVGERVLGSFATHARSGLGPPRPVEGTEYPCASELTGTLATAYLDPLEDNLVRMREDRTSADGDGGVRHIWVVPGPQHHLFSGEVRARLADEPFEVSRSVDRMGYVLAGPALAATGGHDIVSDALVEGAMQVPGNGQPIVQCADRAPTGGYPKIAVLARASLPALVQSPPGTALRFEWTTEEKARRATTELERLVASPRVRGRVEASPAARRAMMRALAR